MTDFEFFYIYVLPLLIIFLGLLGNTLGMIVVGRKKLDKIGPVLIYKLLFAFDSLYLISKYIYLFLLSLRLTTEFCKNLIEKC